MPDDIQTPDPNAPKTFEGSIFDYLPENIRSNPALAKTEGKLDVLVNSYLSAQQYIGKDTSRLVELPVDPSGEEGSKALRGILGKFGLPETLETYKIDAPAEVPEMLKLESPVGEAFKKVAHEAGLLPKQASALYGWLGGVLSEAQKAEQAEFEKAVNEGKAALQREWGEGYNERIYAARDAVQRLGGDALVERLEKAGVANDPVVIKAFAQAAAAMGDKPLGADGSRPASGFTKQTPDELRAMATEKLQQSQSMAWTNPAQSRALAAEAQKLFARANGEAA
jgi:hypothetical protein